MYSKDGTSEGAAVRYKNVARYAMTIQAMTWNGCGGHVQPFLRLVVLRATWPVDIPIVKLQIYGKLQNAVTVII